GRRGGEGRRRRAARLPAAPDRRAARGGGRTGRGAAAARAQRGLWCGAGRGARGARPHGARAVAKRPLRLLGLDRSGPLPSETKAGRPLRPWTVPNAIGYLRLALIPVFLVSAFQSGDGRGALPATLFAVIG